MKREMGEQEKRLLPRIKIIAAAVMILIVILYVIIKVIEVNKTNDFTGLKSAATRYAALSRIEIFGTQTAEAMNAEFSTADPMKMIELFGTQTAVAAFGTPIPTATLLPNQKYWSPPTGVDFSPRFIYDSTRWARTDIRTLASVQVNGCTLRVAGGHPLGPGWTTEESSLHVGHLTFSTILAMDETSPQFITYSLNNGTVFEISSTADFKQCQQDGEAVLKTIIQ